jgi:hypothetical protein
MYKMTGARFGKKAIYRHRCRLCTTAQYCVRLIQLAYIAVSHWGTLKVSVVLSVVAFTETYVESVSIDAAVLLTLTRSTRYKIYCGIQGG